MKDVDDLIYDLLFAEETVFEVDLAEYLDDAGDYLKFTKSIANKINKSGFKIESSVIVSEENNKMVWKIKIKR